MKPIRVLFLVVILLCFAAFLATADDVSSSPLQRFLERNIPANVAFAQGLPENSKWPVQLYYNTPYVGGVLGTAFIPINFSRVTITNGQVTITPELSIGLGYTFCLGDFTFTEDNQVEVNPSFLFGAAVNVGAAETTNSSNQQSVSGTLTAGIFLGFKSVSVYAGYDILNNEVVMGLGTRIEMFRVQNDGFDVFGNRVEPEFGYSKDAKPIQSKWQSDPPTPTPSS